MYKKTIFLMAILIVVLGKYSKACAQPSPANKDSLLTCKILEARDLPDGGTSWLLLVSLNSKKQEVLDLAKWYHNTYSPNGSRSLSVLIFDTQKAYLGYRWAQGKSDGVKCGDKYYYKHCLVEVAVNPRTGIDRISWIPEK